MASPAEFAALYGDAASRAGAALGVDPSVILGQWGLETGWGRSVIPGTNNLGNIKDFAGGGVAATDNMTGSRDKYRAYKTPNDFAADYVSLVQRKYPGALDAGADPTRFAAGLRGYAEDPRYSDKIAQATRMVNAAPGPTMNALGKVVGGVMPSVNAQQRGNMADPASQEWEALNSQFAPQAKPSQAGADPWSDLNAQFAQPVSRPATQPQRPKPQAEPAAETASTFGSIARMAANATPVGMIVNAMRGPGFERDLAKGFGSGFADVGNTIINRASTSIVPSGFDAHRI